MGRYGQPTRDVAHGGVGRHAQDDCNGVTDQTVVARGPWRPGGLYHLSVFLVDSLSHTCACFALARSVFLMILLPNVHVIYSTVISSKSLLPQSSALHRSLFTTSVFRSRPTQLRTVSPRRRRSPPLVASASECLPSSLGTTRTQTTSKQIKTWMAQVNHLSALTCDRLCASFLFVLFPVHHVLP